MLWQLTGGALHATDVTNASRTMLFNVHENRWDGELLALTLTPHGDAPVPERLERSRIRVVDREGNVRFEAPGFMPAWMPAW